jgi:hypothetical protein
MAQHDYNIANQGFPAFRSDLNNALSAIQTNNSGTSRPTGAVAGQIWLDTTNSTSPTLKFFDGTDDISLATINYTANTVDWLDSSITITGLSTTATGTVLTLSDTASTSSVNLILDNQKEVRFRETTANGTNYVALKAPASVASDLTFTLPATDGTNGQVLSTNGSGVLSFTTPSSGISWQSSVKTSGFTAVAGEGYFCDTTSSAFTVTLPASPTAGQQVALVDYAGTFDTNKITLGRNGNKIEGSSSDKMLSTERKAVQLVYIDATQGWLVSSAGNETATAIDPLTYSVEYLVVAGGGGGGNDVGGGGGAGGLLSNTFSATPSVSYTITVGAGGAGSTTGAPATGVNGSNSSISGTGLTTITATGGGGGGSYGGSAGATGATGGSGGGGGGGGSTGGGAGTGTSGQGTNGGAGDGGAGYSGGGGGGASVAGTAGSGNTAGNGGNGSSTYSAWGSATSTGQNSGGTYYYAGGGAGCNDNGSSGTAGLGGGGKHQDSTTNSNGTANTGGGAGGGGFTPNSGGTGGSGIIILRYSGSQRGTGGTVVSSGGYTYHTFTSTSSYTG